MATHNTISYLTGRCCRGNGQLPERGLWHGRHPRLRVPPSCLFFLSFQGDNENVLWLRASVGLCSQRAKNAVESLGSPFNIREDSLLSFSGNSNLLFLPPTFSAAARLQTAHNWWLTSLKHPHLSCLEWRFSDPPHFYFSSAPHGILSEKLPPCSKNFPSFFSCSKPRGTELDLEGALWWE